MKVRAISSWKNPCEVRLLLDGKIAKTSNSHRGAILTKRRALDIDL